MPDIDKYSTVKPMMGSKIGWVADVQEQNRIAAYTVYESIYWGAPDTFKLVQRGTEDKPIYVPSGRIIVETMHRYLAPKLGFTTIMRDPLAESEDPNALLLGQQVLDSLFKRERFPARFNANKRYGLMRGDWAFHLYADPAREAGSRISVFAVDPASLFPIYEEANPDNVIGWHIAEEYTENDGKVYIRRLTYRKVTGTAGPSAITSEMALFKVDDWGGPGMPQAPKPERVIAPLQTLPSPIDHLPIYLIPNFEEPGTIWGSSEMRGVERLLSAINQSVSDEDLSLALDGLGVWVTDAGDPVDDEGNIVPWDLGPARVVQVPTGKNFDRKNGVSNVEPYQKHIGAMQDYVDQAMGQSSIAKGRVTDVNIAESGVALALELAPILARAEEKNLTVEAVLSNMFYDLVNWFLAYEDGALSPLQNITWVPTFGDAMPRNRKQEIDELLKLASSSPQLVPMSYVRNRLRQLGYEDMPEEDALVQEMADEQQLRISIQQDAFGARVDQQVNQELNSASGSSGQ